MWEEDACKGLEPNLNPLNQNRSVKVEQLMAAFHLTTRLRNKNMTISGSFIKKPS